MAALSGAISCHTCLRYSRVLLEGDGAKLMPGLWPVSCVILQSVKEPELHSRSSSAESSVMQISDLI